MSTECRVGVLNQGGTVLSIAVDSDGFPSYMLQRALKTYDTREKALKLVDGGDLSFLDLYRGDRTRQAAPDRGQPRLSTTHRNVGEYIRYSDCSYYYLFTDEGRWEAVGP